MNFAKGQFLVMLLLGAIYAIQLQLIGLQLGLIIGITAGIASFVPLFGFWYWYYCSTDRRIISIWIRLDLFGTDFLGHL